MDDYECAPGVSRNLNELMGKHADSTASESSHITKGMENPGVNTQNNAVAESPSEGAACNTTITKTPSKGSQSAKKKGPQSGKTNTPNQKFVSLRQLCTSPESQSIDSVKTDLFQENKAENDLTKEKEMTERMKTIPDQLLLRTGKVLSYIFKVNLSE